MAHFNKGDIVPFHNKNRTVLRIDQLIGSGNQADIYRALDILRGTYVAAKHSYGPYADKKELFYKKVLTLARNESPHPDLCWPMEVSSLTTDKAFVYTMPLLEGYRPLTGLIKNQDAVTDLQKAQILYQAAAALRALHNGKFVYGDISDQNIMYRVESDGSVKVKFIDCENISLPGFSFGLQGSGKYRAPELLLPDPDREDGRPQSPSIASDVYAFQVLAFRTMMRRHPLDGQLARTKRADDHDGFLEHYARCPRFIFDGTDNSPGPNITRKWDKLPRPMQVYFRDAFSQRCLHHKEARSSLDMLLRCLTLSYPINTNYNR